MLRPFSLLVLFLLLLGQPWGLKSRRAAPAAGESPSAGSGASRVPRKGTLPLPHPFAASSARTPQGYYDSEESKYALWGSPDATTGRKKEPKGRKNVGPGARRPNIVLLLADDQDIELGSMNFMPKTLRILGEGGAHFPNAYVTTPMCCPSRSSMLTGLYVHNHNVYTNNDNCSSLTWQQEHEPHTFATYLNNAGYRTAFFGKYLNEYNGSYIPPGWREWAGLVRNSRFYNYTINVNGNKIKHGDNYYSDYYPDLIANDSIAFLRQSKQYFVHKPVMMVLSFPTPHGPEDSAPQFHHLFHNVTTHRTPSWNFAPNPDKQWLLRYTRKMEPIHMQFTDMLHTKRLQTLQSMDDTVGRLYQELVNLGELDNTYIFYTSDHGYHLGQFGLVKGKSMPFEFDVRVPFYVRGPKVPPGIRISKIVLNVDLAPTFLDIGGVDVPERMDGKSILPLIFEAANATGSAGNQKRRQWRDSFLIERGKVSPKEFGIPGMLGPKMSKDERLTEECQRPEYKSPCQPYQKWECVYDDTFRWRIRKCRHQPQHSMGTQTASFSPRSMVKNNCICSDLTVYPSNEMDDLFEQYAEAQQKRDEHIFLNRNQEQVNPVERRLQRRFLKEHVGKDFKPVFIGSRPKRGLMEFSSASPLQEFDVEGVYHLSRLLDLMVDTSTALKNNTFLDYDDEELDNLPETLTSEEVNAHRLVARSAPLRGGALLLPGKDLGGSMVAGGCMLWPNNTISCPESVYRDPRLWREKKERLDNLIKKLQQKLGELKGIRKHLKRKRPSTSFNNGLGEPGASGRPQQCRCDYMDEIDYRMSQRAEQREQLREERQRLKEERLHKKERKLRRKAKFEHTTCNMEKMNCFSHDNDHWKTAPLWTNGPFCFCQNSNNNTYWCMRTINETHNFLYCEFITGFITFYDLKVDPYQLRNAVYDLDFPTLEELRKQLNMLRSCRGARECHIQFRSESQRKAQRLLKEELHSTSHNHRHWQRRRRWHNEERRRTQMLRGQL